MISMVKSGLQILIIVDSDCKSESAGSFQSIINAQK